MVSLNSITDFLFIVAATIKNEGRIKRAGDGAGEGFGGKAAAEEGSSNPERRPSESAKHRTGDAGWFYWLAVNLIFECEFVFLYFMWSFVLIEKTSLFQMVYSIICTQENTHTHTHKILLLHNINPMKEDPPLWKRPCLTPLSALVSPFSSQRVQHIPLCTKYKWTLLYFWNVRLALLKRLPMISFHLTPVCAVMHLIGLDWHHKSNKYIGQPHKNQVHSFSNYKHIEQGRPQLNVFPR